MKRILFLISVSLVIIGILISGIALASCGFSFNTMSNVNSIQKSYNTTEDFSDIHVDDACGFFDIKIEISDIEKPEISYVGPDNITLTYETKDGKLTVKTDDTRGFFGQNLGFVGATQLTLRLPDKSYGNVKIENASGNISISGITAKNLDVLVASGTVNISDSSLAAVSVDTASGDVYIRDSSASSILTDTASGDVTMRSLTVSGSVSVDIGSGDVEVDSCELGSFSGEGGSGDYEFENTLVSSDLKVDVGSGDIEFSRSDAKELWINTASGDIEGTLLTGKQFDADSSSGRVRVPSSASEGGKCYLRTGSGDIEIRVG